MKLPVLFEPDETEFYNLGLGVLSDCISCRVTIELNGDYFCEIEYPEDGMFADIIKFRSLIVMNDRWSYRYLTNGQTYAIFRVTSIERTLNGVIKYTCNHISYDLSLIPIRPCSFTIYSFNSDVQSKAAAKLPITRFNTPNWFNKFTIKEPVPVSSLLNGSDGSMVSVFGGFWYYYNTYATYVRNSLTQRLSSGLVLRQRHNIQNLSVVSDIFEAYTHVYPYYYDNGDYVEMTERLISLNLPLFETCDAQDRECGDRIVGTVSRPEFNTTSIYALNLTDRFNAKPTEDELREAAESYIENVGVPSIHQVVDIAPIDLSRSDEYTTEYPVRYGYAAETTDIRVGRSVKVITNAYKGLTQITRIVFDVIKDQPTEICVGSEQTQIINAIVRRS